MNITDYPWEKNHEKTWNHGCNIINAYNPTLLKDFLDEIKREADQLALSGEEFDSSYYGDADWSTPVKQQIIQAFDDHVKAAQFYGVALLKHLKSRNETWTISKSKETSGKVYQCVQPKASHGSAAN